MRLSFEIAGEGQGRSLRVCLVAGTVNDAHQLPYAEDKLTALAVRVIAVLRRGNRSRSLAADAMQELRFLGEELQRALIPPALESALKRGEGPLLLDLDESLVPIPFELLFDGAMFLCRRYALGRSVRSSVMRRGQERRTLGMPPRALVIAADPRGDLAEVEAEAEAIVAALEREKVRARHLSSFSRDALRRELKDFDLVHFAGHADFLAADPSASGWHLSEGKLTAADIAELAGGRAMPLVVFSNACESGRTDGFTEGQGDARRAYGLASAFLYAGVRHYVGTQWEVVDGHSATFATAFYQNLGSGQAIGAAVRHARSAVIEAAGEGALAWASYVLYGDPADRPLRRADPKALSLPSARAIAERESAPWKRPTPQTMKRVGAELRERREPVARPSSLTRAIAAGVGAGLLVTALAAALLLFRRPQPSRLAILPMAGADGSTTSARVEACLSGALATAGAPLIGNDQVVALGRTTSVLPADDARARSLGAALGARWVLWGTVADTQATLRLLEVKSGRVLRETHLLSDDTSDCAAQAKALQAALE